jgi:polyisoprenyl-teichoic acid--peptidoglycan teichoic acid transferase
MSDISDTKVDVSPDQTTGQPGNDGGHDEHPGRRMRRPRRIALVSLGSLLALVIAAVIGVYGYVNHALSSIPRVHVAYLDTATSAGQTFLITGAYNTKAKGNLSDLIMLLHINANGEAGGAVTIPYEIDVNVPHHGVESIGDALTTGGPSLLVQTVERVTGIQINHFARIDFSQVSGLVNAIGGVEVTVPAATEGLGYTFTKGVNHLNGVTAIYYARDATITQQDRLLRQEALVRAILARIADNHLLTNPVTAVHVLNSLKSALTVDSNFTNSEITSLATKFGARNASAAVYVTAAEQTVNGRNVLNTAIDNQLWKAVRQNSLAAFAKKYPSTVTPAAAP